MNYVQMTRRSGSRVRLKKWFTRDRLMKTLIFSTLLALSSVIHAEVGG